MATIDGHKIIYTADDEEPTCILCDSCDTEYGCKKCGPEWGWNGYNRTEEIRERCQQ